MAARHAYSALLRLTGRALRSTRRITETGSRKPLTGASHARIDAAADIGAAGDDSSSERRRHLRAGRARQQQYTTRFLASLAASLLLMIAAAHLPLSAGWDPIGWHVIRPSESISVDVLESVMRKPASEPGAPITRHEKENAPSQPEGDREDKDEKTPDEALAASAPPPERVSGRRIFDTAHNMPRIVGGLGAYYIHIEYPEEAVRAGVQGRLLLSFIVEIDGRTSGIEVVQSLHPACDSAAVRALRQTRFVPGRQDGEIVPVRMRLPVRFEIVDRDDGLAAAKDAES